MELNNTKFTKKYTTVYCEDDWEYNAPHNFTIVNSETGEALSDIKFQKGPIKECGVNGVANEDLLLIVLTRLESFQNSEYRCDENEEAINSILDAVDSLRRRTNKRIEKGIEGTSAI